MAENVPTVHQWPLLPTSESSDRLASKILNPHKFKKFMNPHPKFKKSRMRVHNPGSVNEPTKRELEGGSHSPGARRVRSVRAPSPPPLERRISLQAPGSLRYPIR